ncbi:DNA polymerase I [Alkalicoccus urumqiensis]|uniref:DNA polymerase I n=1 Tax=Alkalicoccus urumqiensis TaxID=1548213 RepID=A0A2P6MDE5_ALKUR|nr:DNA polymerase I [Alkalicoccus urumqiensis]PRO64311.1 DNA polymerase I [Alkalicoccus urumqiensis]
MTKNKLVLIDGNSIAYRAFFALPLLNNDKGVYTNAVYGFTTMLLKVLEEEKPTHMMVAFDAGKTTFRHDTYSSYKGTREKTPPELAEQLPVMRELLDAFSIPYEEIENYEADDIIGTLSRHASDAGWETTIFTGDKDLLQLVDKHTTVTLTKKGITNVEAYDPDALHERYGLRPDQIVDMKGLMGDSSDNIPGVPGIGEKTALKLLAAYDTVEGVYEHIDEISGKKMKQNLSENEEQARMSRKLAEIYRTAPVQTELAALAWEQGDPKTIKAFFEEMGFQSLLGRIPGLEEEKPEELADIDVKKAEELRPEMLTEGTALVVESLEENYHHAVMIGVALANENGTWVLDPSACTESDLFREWAENEERTKWVFDAKRAVVTLGWEDVFLSGITFDVQMASYLLDPGASSHDIAAITSRRSGMQVQVDEQVYGKGKKQAVPPEEELVQHLGRKAAAARELKPILEKELKQNEQLALLTDLEMPLSVILGRMERHGVAVDEKELHRIGESLTERLAEMEKTIYSLAGTEFNINSPKQLGEILFEKLGLPVLKKTKTGYSTSADVLEKLEPEHEIISSILTYRQLGKLNSTYIEGLLKSVHSKTGRIHTRFNQALTQTGRLSSTDPNLQNIPIRLEEGRKIRKAFIPTSSGEVILAADYSQIELRVLAHMAQDTSLIEAFNQGMDIHTKTAADVFGVSPEDVDSNMRRTAKAVNFGIVYGISDYGLSQSLGITRKEAAAFIETYLKNYPGVQDYMESSKAFARENGYVTTMMNRRRYLPEITSKNFNQRSFAERTAMNTPIQGTAADIIKQAMVDMSRALDESGLSGTMLLQVHDELIFETPEKEAEKLSRLVAETMEKTVSLDVPLKVDVSYGSTWYDAK